MTIPPKKVEKFVDPYKYVESTIDGEGSIAPGVEASIDLTDAAPEEEKYLLGKNRPLDTEGGDAGCLLRTYKYYPMVHFVRSSFCGKHKNHIVHSDVPTGTNNKKMRQFLVTTGLSIAYKNTFEVCTYNIQTPSKESAPNDHSSDYFGRIIGTRKMNAKKVPGKDTSLAALVKQIQSVATPASNASAGGKTPAEPVDNTAALIQAENEKKLQESLSSRLAKMKEVLEQ